MAVVRNSVGEECYVADEIITSRAGVRIRVGNTDAEVGSVRNKFLSKTVGATFKQPFERNYRERGSSICSQTWVGLT